MDHLPDQDLQAALAASELRTEALQVRLDGTRGILDAISEAIYIQDAQGRFLDVNDGAVAMYGHPRSFFLGNTPEVLSAPDRNDLEAVAQAFGQTLEGTPKQFEFWGLKADGSVFPKNVRLYPGTYLGQKVVIAVAQDITEQKRAEQIQEATYRIAEAAHAARGTQELFQRVHAIVRGLMSAENLYFALWDRATDTVSFPYWIDQIDPVPEPRRLRHGLTEFVLHSGQPLLVDEATALRMEASGEVEPLGSMSLDWLGVPLRGASGVFGTLVIQSYEGGHKYTTSERDLLVYVSAQVAMAIERTRVETEQRVLTAAMDCAIDLVSAINASGRLVFVNQAACASLGYTREELLRLSLWDINPRILAEQWAARWERIRSAGANREETWRRRKDGTVFPVEISSSFLVHEGQEVIFTHARDISSRKVAEAALRSSEEKFSKTFLASPDAININRLNGTYVDVNPAFTRMSGWTREEILGRTTLDLGIWANPDDRIRMKQLLQADGHFVGLEAPFRMKDGTIRTGLLSGTLIQVEGEACLLTITRDISERKAAESALRMAEQRLRTVMANSQAVIYQLDPEGRFMLSEGLGLAALGLAPGQVVGLDALNLYREDLETTEQLRLALDGEGSRRTTKASGRLFDNTLTPVFDSQGRLESVIGIATDMTEHQQMEEALRQSQKLESLGILAGGIAHDFNNLLTVVLGNLNLAQMHLPKNAKAQPYLANMEATVLRATELTKQMLAYSGRGHFLVEPKNLNEVVREVTHLLEVSISKKIQLKFDLEMGLPAIQADAAQIQQVVMNLVTNASDAIGDQEGVIRLRTSSALLDERELQSAYRGESLKPGRYVLLEVTDTGIGMASEVMARIFDPFFTTKATGRGLGLSAMLGILRGHGAGLGITSEVACGSSFRICFPASEEKVSDPGPAMADASSGLLRGRILLVDDEDLILDTIGSALEILGLEVFKARDGLEALERFRDAKPRPNLVLMDLTMPRMDGREAFRAMHDLDPSVPIVLSSGFSEQDSIQTLSGPNPMGFIQKPYQIKELRQLLQRVLSS